MSSFDNRWRRLASAARRAPEDPMPALPRIALHSRETAPRHAASRWEPLALRIAFALGAAAYALAAWVLPVAIDAAHPRALAALPSPPHPPAISLPRPPRLPPPEQVLAAIAAAADSLSFTRADSTTDGHSL